MATTVLYTVIDGEILSENRNGVKRDYVPDPLGNTLALLDNTQAQTDTFSYYPYGEVASRTGTTQTPFQYVGTRGYYQDNSGRTYVRARHLRTAHGRWMTQDPIGFHFSSLYIYAYASPILYDDRSGLLPTFLLPVLAPAEFSRKKVCNMLFLFFSPRNQDKVNDCVNKSTPSGAYHSPLSDDHFKCLMEICTKGKISYNKVGYCCDKNGKDLGFCAYAIKEKPGFGQFQPNCEITFCTNHMASGNCIDRGGDTSLPAYDFNMVHEMLHCCKVSHGSPEPRSDWQRNDIVSCCINNIMFGGNTSKCKRH